MKQRSFHPRQALFLTFLGSPVGPCTKAGGHLEGGDCSHLPAARQPRRTRRARPCVEYCAASAPACASAPGRLPGMVGKKCRLRRSLFKVCYQKCIFAPDPGAGHCMRDLHGIYKRRLHLCCARVFRQGHLCGDPRRNPCVDPHGCQGGGQRNCLPGVPAGLAGGCASGARLAAWGPHPLTGRERPRRRGRHGGRRYWLRGHGMGAGLGRDLGGTGARGMCRVAAGPWH